MDEEIVLQQETLARASARTLDDLLVRKDKEKRKRVNLFEHTQVLDGHVPSTTRARTGACGAPAVAARDEEQAQQPCEGKGAQLPTAACPSAEVAESSEDSDWEEVAGSRSADAQPDSRDDGRQPAKSVATDGVLTISLSKEGQPQLPRRRTTFTKADKEFACLIHRCHLLCLLGRGLLMDQASSHPLLQALLLSLLPSDVATHFRPQEGQQLSALAPLMEWFRGRFKAVDLEGCTGAGERARSEEAAEVHVEEGWADSLEAAMRGAKGVEGLVDRLQQVVDCRKGRPEEIVALFVALLRAQGFVARTIHSLQPSPVKPSDALRQQELSIHALTARSSRSSRRYVAPASGTIAAKVEPSSMETGLEQEMGTCAAGKTGQGRGQGGGGGSKGKAVSGVSKAARRSAPKKEQAGGRKRPREQDAEMADVAVAGQRRTGKQRLVVDSDRSRQDAGGGCLLEGNGAGRRHGRGKHPSRGRGSGRGTAQRSKRGQQTSEPVAAAALGELDAVGEQAAGEIQARKRKCDEEEEQQLALAMAATAFEAGRSKRAAGSGEGKGKTATPPSAQLLKQRQPVGAAAAAEASSSQAAAPHGAMFGGGSVQGVGSCWAEVFWGPFDTGRWVPVDPLTGWVDRAADMEVLAPRGQPLTYVVAFAGGGAKEVIQRYSSSFLAAEKLRDSDWWESTLRPLRSQEVAASIAAATAAAGEHPQAALAGKSQPAPLAPSGGQAAHLLPRQASLPSKEASKLSGKDSASASMSAAAPSSAAERARKLLAAREDAELAQRTHQAKRSLPTTIDGFKSHPLYVLQRHIARYQALAPDAKKCGLHRGEAYYLREDVCELHTAERWRREGREVMAAELPQPAKRIKKRAQTGAAGQGDGGGEDQEDVLAEVEGPVGKDTEFPISNLYGFWQTVPWTPPAATGGKVPRNERGNVEVPPFAAALPAGTVHLRLPYIAPVCRKLQVDYAMALTGFEPRGGRMVPVLEGVVICSEFETLVVSTYLEEERQRAERARAKREEEADLAWRLLLRAMLARVRLQESYGEERAAGVGSVSGAGGSEWGLVGGEGNTMAEAASELLRANQAQQERGGSTNLRRESGVKGPGRAEVHAVDLTGDSDGNGAKQPPQRRGGKRKERQKGSSKTEQVEATKGVCGEDECAVRLGASFAEELDTEEI